MAMRLGERVKPFLLASLLTFMVGSYFVSDTFTRGASVLRGVSVERIAGVVCVSRPKSERADCGANVEQALVVTNLACLAPIRDMFVCQNPTKGKKKGSNNSCQEEGERLSECIQVHLEPQLHRRGFSSEEITRLDLGNFAFLKLPSPDGGGGKGEGKGGKGEGGGQGGKEEAGQGGKGGGGGQGGKGQGGGSEGDAAGGQKPTLEVIPETDGGEGGDGAGTGPKVEVVEGSKDGDGNAQ